MRTGNMDEKLVLMRPVRTRNDFGEQQVTWEQVRTVWAERVKARGWRSEEVGEHFPDHSAEFNIRFVHPAEENWRVQHVGGMLYTITAIIPNRRADMKTLVCDRVNE